ncbi:hypothetical protein GP486_001968 [Trichoglossum hirsutum]|uniref:Uncharacterized protein n=1 Tax=Trichoglossum hirsutum TaxID=265104 RepID=A0A9P8RSJ1_9PEZI|nr:hypothetical protein GP486_001968 [Trichoglossum hirsutum]
MIPISLEGITVMTLQVIYQMYIGKTFYDSKSQTRWEKVAEMLSNKHLKWTPNASEVEAIYKEYDECYKYDYLPTEDQKAQGTMSKNDSGTTFKMIALYLTVVFGSERNFRFLLKRDLAAWKPAFHRVGKYWIRLSNNSILQGHSWESVKTQTVFLLGKVEELCTSKIPHLSGYKADLQYNFSYKQNMYLIGRALKLGALAPFMAKRDNITSKLLTSSVFGEGANEHCIILLDAVIRRYLICYLEPPLSLNYREIFHHIRKLQAEYSRSTSDVAGLPLSNKMRLVYHKAMTRYMSQYREGDEGQLGESDEESDEESGEEQLLESDEGSYEDKLGENGEVQLEEKGKEQLEESDEEEQFRGKAGLQTQLSVWVSTIACSQSLTKD